MSSLNFCRLCLQKFTGPYTIFSQDPKLSSMLKNLFPGMNINLVQTPKICLECFKYVQFSYTMRKTVIQNEQKINCNVTLLQAIKKNTCRLCLNTEMLDATIFLYETNNQTMSFLEVKSIIEIAVTGILFEVFEKPVVCNSCWQIVKLIYLFKKKCFATEKILKFYCSKRNLTSLADSEIESVSICYNSNLEKFSGGEKLDLIANLISKENLDNTHHLTHSLVDNFIRPVDVYLNNFNNDEDDDIFKEEIDDIFVESPKIVKEEFFEIPTDTLKEEISENRDDIEEAASKVKKESEELKDINSGMQHNIKTSQEKKESSIEVQIRTEISSVEKENMEINVEKTVNFNIESTGNQSNTRANSDKASEDLNEVNKAASEVKKENPECLNVNLETVVQSSIQKFQAEDITHKSSEDILQEKNKNLEYNVEILANFSVDSTENQSNTSTMNGAGEKDDKINKVSEGRNGESTDASIISKDINKDVIQGDKKKSQENDVLCKSSEAVLQEPAVVKNMVETRVNCRMGNINKQSSSNNIDKKEVCLPTKMDNIVEHDYLENKRKEIKNSDINVNTVQTKLRRKKLKTPTDVINLKKSNNNNSKETENVEEKTKSVVTKRKRTSVNHEEIMEPVTKKQRNKLEMEVRVVLENIDYKVNYKKRKPTFRKIKSKNLDEVEWGCNQCEFKTKYKQHLNRHNLIHNKNGKMLECSKCVYSTYIKRNFIRHLLVHNSDNFLQCTHCIYSTVNKCHLKKHMLIHQKLDSKKETNPKGLEAGTEPKTSFGFRCEECPFETSKEVQIISHLRTHKSKEKILKCMECHYITIRTHSLKNHMELHNQDSSQKNFNCKLCSFKGKRSTHLASHMLTHEKEFKFNCSQCSYKAKRKSHLVTHMLRHQSGNKKVMFQCPYCKYKSVRKEHLRLHCHNMHHDREEVNCNKTKVMVQNDGNGFSKEKKTATCPYCPYRSYASTLAVHIFTGHFPSNSEQMECNDCLYKTDKRKLFLKHINLHRSNNKKRKD